MSTLIIEVSNLDDDELDCVGFYVRGDGALAWAKTEQSLAGSNWEGVDRDPNYALTFVPNYPGLQEAVEKELSSYVKEGTLEIDWSLYSLPDEDENEGETPEDVLAEMSPFIAEALKDSGN